MNLAISPVKINPLKQIHKISPSSNLNINTNLKADTISFKSISFKEIETINKTFHSSKKENLDKRIAGMQKAKARIRASFIDRIKNPNAKESIPNAILIYGHEGSGKTSFIEATANESDCNLLEILPFENFTNEIEDSLIYARNLYNKTGKRTIILLKGSDITLDDSSKNEDNVYFMSNILDNCAKTPDESQDGFATTIFFETSKPQLISKKLLSSNKINTIINIPFASNEEIIAIIKNYISRYKQNGGKIDTDNIDYEKLAEILMPNQKGCHINESYKHIVQRAIEKYAKAPSIPFEEHLEDTANKKRRYYTQSKYMKQLEINDSIKEKWLS